MFGDPHVGPGLRLGDRRPAFRGLTVLVFVEFSGGLSEVGQYASHSVKSYHCGSEAQRTADGLRGHSFAEADGLLAWI